MKRKIILKESELTTLIQKIISEATGDISLIENELDSLVKKESTLRFPQERGIHSYFELPSYSFYDDNDYPVLGVIRYPKKNMGIFSEKIYITSEYYYKLAGKCDLTRRMLNEVIFAWASGKFDDRLIYKIVINSRVFT